MERKWMDVGSISGIVSASAAVGGLLTRVAHVADDARKIDDPHLMCEKVIQFETCTFVYYFPLATYSFSAGCLRPSGWAPHALCLLAGRQHGRFLFLCALRAAVWERCGEKKINFLFRRTRFFHYPKSLLRFSGYRFRSLVVGRFLVHLSRVSSTLLIRSVHCFYNHREARNGAYRNKRKSNKNSPRLKTKITLKISLRFLVFPRFLVNFVVEIHWRLNLWTL